MRVRQCKYCGTKVTGRHSCPEYGRVIEFDDDDSFLLSAVVGFATDSTLTGALVGGDLMGAAIGEMIRDEVDTPAPSSEPEDAPKG
jgi:hypothetical protein